MTTPVSNIIHVSHLRIEDFSPERTTMSILKSIIVVQSVLPDLPPRLKFLSGSLRVFSARVLRILLTKNFIEEGSWCFQSQYYIYKYQILSLVKNFRRR